MYWNSAPTGNDPVIGMSYWPVNGKVIKSEHTSAQIVAALPYVLESTHERVLLSNTFLDVNRSHYSKLNLMGKRKKGRVVELELTCLSTHNWLSFCCRHWAKLCRRDWPELQVGWKPGGCMPPETSQLNKGGEMKERKKCAYKCNAY